MCPCLWWRSTDLRWAVRSWRASRRFSTGASAGHPQTTISKSLSCNMAPVANDPYTSTVASVRVKHTSMAYLTKGGLRRGVEGQDRRGYLRGQRLAIHSLIWVKTASRVGLISACILVQTSANCTTSSCKAETAPWTCRSSNRCRLVLFSLMVYPYITS